MFLDWFKSFLTISIICVLPIDNMDVVFSVIIFP